MQSAKGRMKVAFMLQTHGDSSPTRGIKITGVISRNPSASVYETHIMTKNWGDAVDRKVLHFSNTGNIYRRDTAQNLRAALRPRWI